MEIEQIKEQLANLLLKVSSVEEIEKIRIKYLGKKGFITNLTKSIKSQSMNIEERKNFGLYFNELKIWAKNALEQALKQLLQQIKKEKKDFISIDLTLPGIRKLQGSLHPITLIQMELEFFFQSMSFIVSESYHIETERYNFDLLNIPYDHPAREMQDTFWLTNSMLMRTHTSANQVRMLEKYGVPLRAIFPGRCFRYEAVDASHENTFYQLEGLMVDKNISIAHLIGIMKILLAQIFRCSVLVRLRPGYFPFVEPGFELDCQCLICQGNGCKTCKQTGWIELLPCGMIHPRVLKVGGINSDEWSGFAFGLGLTRLAMMKYGVSEIRLFNSGDVRFLEQFAAII